MTIDQVKVLLSRVIHPESKTDIVSGGVVQDVFLEGEVCKITLQFRKSRDPFTNSIKKQVIKIIEENLPGFSVSVIVKEGDPKVRAERPSSTAHIDKIIAIASGKGGVGKSTVAANMAVTLAQMGYRVGLLDADIYGPSQPKMFGVEDYRPVGEEHNGVEYILPMLAEGVKIASIGFFINADDALIWRGPMAVGALKQLIHHTWWGELDFLLIDLPPGTGDIHLSVVGELKVDGAIIVSTPQQVALADVVRGIKMFEASNINVPVLGIIENMSYFTPAELPDNKYYIFGRDGVKNLASKLGVGFLGEVPIIQGIMEASDDGRPVSLLSEDIGKYYLEICQKVVGKWEK